MKVKIFCGDRPILLENKINEWLADNKVNILPIQSESAIGRTASKNITITIFYNEIEGE